MRVERGERREERGETRKERRERKEERGERREMDSVNVPAAVTNGSNPHFDI